MSSVPGHAGGAEPRPEDEISLLDFAIVIAKRKWMVITLTVLAAIVAIAISFTLTPHFTATARLLPPQQAGAASSGLLGALGQLGGGLGSGVGGVLGIKNPSDIYVGMLRSRTIADALVDRFKLQEAYGLQLRSDTRARLAKRSSISVGKDNLITIDVEDTDPKRAAAIANAYVEELEKLTSVMAVTEAGQRRLFFERQLAQAKDNLLKAELAARTALDEGGLAAVDAYGRTILQTTATLRARVTAKEVELNAMRGYATDQNPQYHRAQQELAALREQLAKLERGESAVPGGSGKNKPEGVKNVSLLREVRYHEVLFELLARQYEMAKVDEAKEGAVIQVLDKAIEPDWKSWPRRTTIVVATTAVALVLAIVLAFVLEALERTRRDPAGGRRLDELKRSLWRRRA